MKILRRQCNLIKIKKCYSIHNHIFTCLQDITCTRIFTMHRRHTHSSKHTMRKWFPNFFPLIYQFIRVFKCDYIISTAWFPLFFCSSKKMTLKGLLWLQAWVLYKVLYLILEHWQKVFWPLDAPLPYYSCLAACSWRSRCWYQCYFYRTMRCLFCNLFSHFSHT